MIRGFDPQSWDVGSIPVVITVLSCTSKVAVASFCGAMVARLTSNQKGASSSLVSSAVTAFCLPNV
jgi:hypothetical protein